MNHTVQSWVGNSGELTTIVLALLGLGFVLHLTWRIVRYRRRHRPYWARQHERRKFWGNE